MNNVQQSVAALWRSRLGRFLELCQASGSGDEPTCLREARSLFCHADTVDASDLEAMIAACAFESAALAMIGPSTGYMMSRGGTGICLASVYLPGAEQRTCEGETPALALLAATATALWHMADGEAAGLLQSEVAWLN